MEFDLTKHDNTDDERPSRVVPQDVDATQWESGAQFAVGSRTSGLIASGSPTSMVAVPSGSRFQCLADRSSESDNESVLGIDRKTRRRLSLVWRVDPMPNSHDKRFLRVRRAMQFQRQQEPICRPNSDAGCVVCKQFPIS